MSDRVALLLAALVIALAVLAAGLSRGQDEVTLESLFAAFACPAAEPCPELPPCAGTRWAVDMQIPEEWASNPPDRVRVTELPTGQHLVGERLECCGRFRMVSINAVGESDPVELASAVDCQPVPEPGVSLSLALGCLALAGIRGRLAEG